MWKILKACFFFRAISDKLKLFKFIISKRKKNNSRIPNHACRNLFLLKDFWSTSKGRIIRRFSQSKFEGKKTQNKKTGGLNFPPYKKKYKKVEILIKKDTQKKKPADYSTGGLFYLSG
jgi:hypothetical protein